MNGRRKLIIVLSAAMGLAIPAIAFSPNGPQSAQQRRGERGSRVEADENLEVLTRGPVHEAFAEPVVFEAEAGFVVSREPPEPIEEMPPAQRPAGDNVAWIPGYWGWDDDRGDFLWVSGIWRLIPPGMEWVPGYWAETSGGFYWVSGFWRPIEVEAVTYLPEPPASLEGGPVGDAPGPDYVWASGT